MRGPSETCRRGSNTTQINQGQHIRPPDLYYLIDIGLSRQYPSRDASDVPLRGYHTHGSSIPEHRHGERSNPFRTDIYCLGNFVRESFLQVRVACV
jgi:hypothetical protein